MIANDNKPLVVLGAGGHAKVVINLLQACGLTIAACIDQRARLAGLESLLTITVQDYKDSDLPQFFPTTSYCLANGLGLINHSLSTRSEIYRRFSHLGYRFPILKHPNAIIATSAIIAAGAQIHAGAIVQAAAIIAENSIINSGAIVEHDVQIGAHAHIAPGAVICGGVSIGDHAQVGAGAVIIPGCQIGAHASVGAGAVVSKNVPDHTTVSGIPAKPHNKN